MPVKIGKKKYKTFGSAVGALKKKGKSDAVARKIVGSIESKKKKKRKRR